MNRFIIVTDDNGKRIVAPFNSEQMRDSDALHRILCEWSLNDYSVSFTSKAPNRRNVIHWYTGANFSA